MSDELKPCPFCGGTNTTVIIDDYFDAVACRDCEASGPTGKRVPAAIKAWNERPEMADNATLRQSLADQDAEIQRLRAEVQRLTQIAQDLQMGRNAGLTPRYYIPPVTTGTPIETPIVITVCDTGTVQP